MSQELFPLVDGEIVLADPHEPPPTTSNVSCRNSSLSLLFVLFCSSIALLSLFQFGYGIGELNSAQYFVPVYVNSSFSGMSANISVIMNNGTDEVLRVIKTCYHMQDFFKDCIPLPSELHGRPLIDPWYWLVGSFQIAGLVGAFTGCCLADLLGRLWTLFANNFVFLMGYVLEGLFSTFTPLLIGRILHGFSAGVATTAVGMYISEITPRKFRGIFGVLSNIAITFGIFCVQLAALFSSENQLWRPYFSSVAICAIVQSIVIPFLPRSPAWLLKRKSLDAVRRSLSKLRCGNEDVVRREFDELVSKGKAKAYDALPRMPTRTLICHLVVAIGMQVVQQFSPINAMMFYSTAVFETVRSAVKPEVVTVLVSAVNCVSNFIPLFLIDRVGRKPLLLVSLILQIACSISLMVSLLFVPSGLVGSDSSIPGWIAIVSVLAFIASFELGVGPVAWMITVELFTERVRPYAQGIAMAVNWLCVFFVALFFPSMQKLMRELSFVPSIVILLAGIVLIGFGVRETKGKTIREIVFGSS